MKKKKEKQLNKLEQERRARAKQIQRILEDFNIKEQKKKIKNIESAALEDERSDTSW